MIKNSINKLLLSLILLTTYNSYLFGADHQSIHDNQSPLDILLQAIAMQQHEASSPSHEEIPELIPLNTDTLEAPIVERSTTQFDDRTEILENIKKPKPAKRKHAHNDTDNYDENDFSNDSSTSDDDYENTDNESFMPKRPKNIPTIHAIDESTGKKVLKCSWKNCNFQCKYLSALTIHVHTHTGDKPFTCKHPECNYTARFQGDLTRHMLRHAGKKPFECTFQKCNRAFYRKADLARHVFIHTGEKPYKCNHKKCNYASTHSSALKIHSRTHTGDKPFKCTHPECNYAAAQLDSVKSHIKNNHKPLYLQMQENKTNNTTNSITKMDDL